MESNTNPAEPSIESLAAGWQELARQMRFLALRGTAVGPAQAEMLKALLQGASRAMGAVARGQGQLEMGLSLKSASRGVALRMLESGCPSADELGVASGLGLPPSSNHVLVLTGLGAGLSGPELLELLAARKQRGLLELRTERETFTLEFDQGQVAHLHTDRPLEGERLGELLVRRGLLSYVEVENLRAGDPRRRIGELLLAGQHVTPRQLLGALEAQVHLLVGRLCTARTEGFCFWQGPLVLARPRLRLDLSDLMFTTDFVAGMAV